MNKKALKEVGIFWASISMMLAYIWAAATVVVYYTVYGLALFLLPLVLGVSYIVYQIELEKSIEVNSNEK